MRTVMTCIMLSAALALLSGLAGCPNSPDALFHEAQYEQTQKQYDKALANYDKILAKEPGSLMALSGKARCTYELGKYAEALALFEKFLQQSEEERATYRSERYDAEFYRDKCKQQLGQDVPQDPTAIPPPPMGE
jgi:tetratricopeptide (TPR) repeat protein